jgi:alpha-mannosidase
MYADELSGTFSARNIEPAKVVVEAVKKRDDSDDLIARLYETEGRAADALLTFNRAPQSARRTRSNGIRMLR